MQIKQEFHKIMETQTEIALATCIEGQPNVRIVNFFYDMEKKCLFFSATKGDQKIREFDMNPKVAFTTIPIHAIEHVRGLQGMIKKSELTIYDVAQQWIQKIPHYEKNIEEVGDMLVLFELHFEKVDVVLGMEARETLIVN